MPSSDYWDQEDEWHTDRVTSGARHVRPSHWSPSRARVETYERRSDFLIPEHTHSGGLHRTRSQGHSPMPNVTIYNTTRMDNESSPNVRTDQRTPGPSPGLEPRGRPLGRAGEWALEDELAELRLEVARNRRSRSRSVHIVRDESPSHHHHDHHDYERLQLQIANEKLKEAEERLAMEKREELIKNRIQLKFIKDKREREEEEARLRHEEDRLKKEWDLKREREERKRLDEEAEQKRKEERIKQELELKREKEERKRIEEAREAEAERKRIIAENTAKIEREEREAKAARDAAVLAFKQKQAEEEAKAKAEQERIIHEYERKKFEDERKAKKAREELIMQMKIEEQERKEKEKAEWERFLRIQKDKEDEEKAKKKKAEEELEDAMRKRLAHFGFQENQIQAMIKPEDQRTQHQLQLQEGMTPNNPLRLTHQPTYVKVHKEHLAIDTLLYYDIPYEIDRTDPNYIIILREMDNRETEILFEHTRRLRSRGPRLLIEERGDHSKPDYAWVRRRKHSVSPSRRRSSPKRVVGIKEMFF